MGSPPAPGPRTERSQPPPDYTARGAGPTGSPWEKGYVESFNGKLRDELLNRVIFFTLREAQVLIEAWRQEYKQRRPHSALGYRSPAPEAIREAAGLT